MIPLDLTKIARGTRPEVRMQAEDTLFVGSSFLARLAEFVKPSAGVNYVPAP